MKVTFKAEKKGLIKVHICYFRIVSWETIVCWLSNKRLDNKLGKGCGEVTDSDEETINFKKNGCEKCVKNGLREVE